MNWDALGSIAETVGAFGVMATLAYLAIQIRENSAIARSTMALTAAQAGWHLQLELARADAVGVVFAGGNDLSSLSGEDQLKFDLLMGTTFNWYEEVYQLHRADRVAADYWLARTATLRGLLTSPGIVEWWEQNQEQFTPHFRAEVARQLEAR